MGVQDLKNKGKEAFKRKRYELAVTAYLEYLQFEANDEEAVDGFFAAAKKANETKGKSMFGGFLGKVGVGGRDPKKRMHACFRALAKNPHNKSVLMTLGDAALQANAPAAASAAFKFAAEEDPDDSLPWKKLGEALGKAGKIREALDALGEAVRINPRDQDSAKLRKNLAAEGALKIAGYETAKSSRDLIKDKGVAENLERETRMQLTPEHAASEIDRVKAEAEADPTNSRIWVRLADLHLNGQDEESALDALHKAVEHDRDNYDLSVRLGDMRLRRLQSSAKDARDAHTSAPDDAGKKSAYEEAHAMFLEAALKEYGRRVREHPLDLSERFRYGRHLLQAKRIDEALAEFQQTVRDPNLKTASLRLQSRCFQSKNLIGLALKKMEEAIQDFPSLASGPAKEVHYEYADMLESKGEKDKAREIFEQIVEADASFKDSLSRLETLSS